MNEDSKTETEPLTEENKKYIDEVYNILNSKVDYNSIDYALAELSFLNFSMKYLEYYHNKALDDDNVEDFKITDLNELDKKEGT